jgi:hypothetical protein
MQVHPQRRPPLFPEAANIFALYTVCIVFTVHTENDFVAAQFVTH